MALEEFRMALGKVPSIQREALILVGASGFTEAIGRDGHLAIIARAEARSNDWSPASPTCSITGEMCSRP